MDYNLDDLDASLSSAVAAGAGPQNNRGGRRPNPVRRGSATPNVPSTRRGSLVPCADLVAAGSRRRRPARLHELDLFHFDLRELVKDVLLTEGESRVSYHEYAVFSAADSAEEPHSPSIMSAGDEGLRMFRDAVKNGHGLDDEVSLYYFICRICHRFPMQFQTRIAIVQNQPRCMKRLT